MFAPGVAVGAILKHSITLEVGDMRNLFALEFVLRDRQTALASINRTECHAIFETWHHLEILNKLFMRVGTFLPFVLLHSRAIHQLPLVRIQFLMFRQHQQNSSVIDPHPADLASRRIGSPDNLILLYPEPIFFDKHPDGLVTASHGQSIARSVDGNSISLDPRYQLFEYLQPVVRYSSNHKTNSRSALQNAQQYTIEKILIILCIMGIDGLLQLFKPLIQQEHLSSFAKQTVGIDAFPWLYKGVYMHYATLDLEHCEEVIASCSNYILLMLELMESYQITPYFVFDGRSLPMKQDTITKRKETRDSNQDKFIELRAKKQWQQARKMLTRTIRVTEEIVCEAISVLKHKGIQFIVSPYETDSQLSKLWVSGKVDCVITEDSDFIVYGCKKILYKLTEQGECDFLDLTQDIEKVDSSYLKSFLQMDTEHRIEACVMAGCDYIASIKGIGIKKAIKYITEQGDIQGAVKKLQSQQGFKDKIPEGYTQKAKNATLIFKHALVFNPDLKQFENFTPIPPTSLLSQHQTKSLGDSFSQYLDNNIFDGLCEPRSLKKRQFKTDFAEKDTQINPLRLKELEELSKKRSELRKKLKEQREDAVELNALDALESISKPVTISQFWANSIFKQILQDSLSYILASR